MLQTIEIPSPSGADTETVVTALETAAIFGAKGDGHEAMRWLRRAAESAGAAGDDERALSLSRIAAELHDELSGTRATAAHPSPPSPPPPPSARVSHPPPPSSRTAPPPSVVPRPSQVPRPGSSVAPAVSPSVSPSLSPPLASRPPLALVPSEPAAAPPPALPQPEAAPEPTPAPVLEAPVAASVAAVADVTPPLLSIRPTTSSTGARHAARVAVAISTTKVGYLEVRLLAEGEAPRLGASEALLVMLDPTSTLLSR